MSKICRINEFVKRIGRATSTVRRWEREGRLAARRLASGQRDDLASQIKAMEQYCRAGAIAVDEWIQEAGGGMNFRRERFLAMTGRIQRGETERVLIAHKDRLVRFGFDLPDHLSREHGCEIVVVKQESLWWGAANKGRSITGSCGTGSTQPPYDPSQAAREFPGRAQPGQGSGGAGGN